MNEEARDLSELARALISACAQHLDPNDAETDAVVQGIHAQVGELPHPDMFMQMMAAFVISAERKSMRQLPDDLFRSRSDIRAGYLLDGNGSRILVLRMFETLDLLADLRRQPEALLGHLRILTEGFGASATLSFAYVYLSFAVGVADFEEVPLEEVLHEWFLDEAVSLDEEQ